MFYIIAIFIFSALFILFSIIILFGIKTSKNIKKSNIIEFYTLLKIKKIYKYIYCLCPATTIRFLKIRKEKLINRQIPVLLDHISSNLYGGISIAETLKDTVHSMKQPLKNEIILFITLAKKQGKIKALELIIPQTEIIFLKLMWIIINTHFKNGGNTASNIKGLKEIIITQNNIKTRINAQLIQSRLQLYICTTLPYFLFLVMRILYPELIIPVLSSGTGIITLISALFLHTTGAVFFHRIIRFNTSDNINAALLYQYISYSMNSGLSITESFKTISNCKIVSGNLKIIINSVKSSQELIQKLKNNDCDYIKKIGTILQKSHELGIPVSQNLIEYSKEILNNLENKSLLFQQTIATKALIPLFLCIFPATYILILSPVLIMLLY